jgi:drug/metabolite transporter (DMT)-like permease
MTLLALLAALLYLDRLRSMSPATHPWWCLLAQTAGGVTACLAAVAALRGADPAVLGGLVTLLGAHLASTQSGDGA